MTDTEKDLTPEEMDAIKKQEGRSDRLGRAVAQIERLQKHIDAISVASGFPIVENREQVTQTIIKRIKRVDAERDAIRSRLEKVEKIIDSLGCETKDNFHTDDCLRCKLSSALAPETPQKCQVCGLPLSDGHTCFHTTGGYAPSLPVETPATDRTTTSVRGDFQPLAPICINCGVVMSQQFIEKRNGNSMILAPTSTYACFKCGGLSETPAKERT